MPDNNSSNVEERFLTDEDFLKILGIYFDTASGILDTLGSDKEIATNGAKFIAKVGFGVGTAIDLTVNLSKDENSDDFYVVLSTIGKNIIKYKIGSALSKRSVITAVSAGAASLLGLSTAPVWLTIATTVAVVVVTTYVTDKALNLLENELSDLKEIEFCSPTIYGKIIQKEFMIQELEQNNQTTKDFCMKMYPKFARYIQTYDLNKIDINASNPMTYINKISEDEILSLNDVNKIIQDLNSYSNEKDGNFIEFIGKRNSGNL